MAWSKIAKEELDTDLHIITSNKIDMFDIQSY